PVITSSYTLSLHDALPIFLLWDLRRDELKKVGRFVSLWFDLERNLKPFYQLLNQDERLSYMVERYHGLRLMGIPDLFEAMCWCRSEEHTSELQSRFDLVCR